MATDTKLSEAQLSKTYQLDGFRGALLDKFAGPLMTCAVRWAKNVLAPVATRASTSAIAGNIQMKMHARGAVRAGEGITWVNLNENINYFIKIIKPRGKSVLLIDEIIGTVEHEIKRKEVGFFGMLLEILSGSMLRIS